MTGIELAQLAFYLLILLLLIKPLGWYMARVFEEKPCGLDPLVRPLEKLIYRLCNIRPQQEMNWKQYLSSLLIFNMLSLLAVYFIQRLQIHFPFNPQQFPSIQADLAFNTAASFSTNTNWQAYSGENSLSYSTQMLAITVQHFLSAATGLAVAVALIRGLIRHETTSLGNYWVDIIRGTLYILLPLAFILALILASQGLIQNFKAYQKVSLLDPVTYQEVKKDAAGNMKNEIVKLSEQTLPMGPVASQVAIKELGSNGGGFFNTNSAHPFENPTPFTNFIELLAILLLPASLCYTFGLMVNDRRQGWALLTAMFVIFLPFMSLSFVMEQQGNPALSQMGIDPIAEETNYPGGNMEGKETRFGILNSTLWASATTATSNGSVNAMHDSFTPLGGLIPLWLMHLGEVVFGGIGSGLYGMLMLVLITVFVAGLMVGRTPEYLGKKIEPYEMKMAAVVVLLLPMMILFLTSIAAITPQGTQALGNPGAHGFSEILYAFTSMGTNNGSAFAGLQANTPFYNITGGLEMLFFRFWIAIATLATAGALARKKTIPTSSGTLATHTPLFIILLICVTLIIGALTFFPALALGPVVEQLTLWGQYGH
jgi:K+-transporting ATPase ATPase A chain